MGKWAEFPTLGYTWSLKEVPLQAAPPRIGRYNEYPPLSPQVVNGMLKSQSSAVCLNH